MKRALFFSLALVALFAAACDDSKGNAPLAPPAKPVAAVSAVPAVAAADGGVAGAAAAPANYIYSYNPIGKRDPFRSFTRDQSAPGKSFQQQVCAEPLCQYDLDQLTLVAVVSGDANPIAMLQDTTGTGYVVRRNSKVGKQGGKVTQIMRNCVVVTEYFQTPDGKVNPNKVDICVKQDEKAAQLLDLLDTSSQ
ncbi:MAG: pilus assembly protein PilP [Myxococcaceae bacterium]|nr:pilus assembly protein PilP [Myxococcaceae bacterium]